MGNVHISDNGGGYSMLGRDEFSDRDWCSTCRRRGWCRRYTTAQRSGLLWCPAYEYKNRVVGE